jgi:hypothetical protein
MGKDKFIGRFFEGRRLLFLLCLLTGGWTSFAQPANDNFADRIVLAGTNISVEGSNTGATREAGEPNSSGPGRVRYEKSVWWSWSAPTNGLVVMQTSRSDFDSVLEVYTGNTLSGLTLTTNADLASLPDRVSVTFRVAAGVAYHIVVGGVPFGTRGDSGNIVLQLSFFETPPNDDFAFRTGLGSGDTRIIGSNAGATAEPDVRLAEPDVRLPWWPLPGRSVWWSWTATNSGPVTVTLDGPAYDPDDPLFLIHDPVGVRLAICTGENVKTLHLVDYKDQPLDLFLSTAQVTINAVGGVTYQIQVDGSFGLQNSFALNIAQTTPPSVVIVSPRMNAQYRSGSEVSIRAEAFDSDGKIELVEFQLVRFVGWPVEGTRFVQENSPFATVLSNALPGHYSLTAWATDDRGAKAKSFSVPFDVRPINDNFDDRISFGGAPVTVTGTIANASWEPPANSGGDVWWSWTAPVSGLFTMSATWPGGLAALRVFKGTSLTNLSLVAESAFDPSAPYNTKRLVFRAAAGATYQIALISAVGTYDLPYDLTVTPSVPPSIVIRQPTNHAFFEWNEPVTITAEASDPDGVVSRVDFFEGDFMLLGSVTNPPFTLAARLTNGNHLPTLRTRATDNAGLTSVSLPIGVLVGYEPVSHPPNDNFADRILLTGAPVTATGSLDNVTSESGEPPEATSSVWWAWTAPANGTYTIVVAATNFFPSLVVFRGSNLTNLTSVASGWGGVDPDFSTRAAFQAEAGITYAIAVSSSWATRREFTLNLIPTKPPFVLITNPTDDAKFIVGDDVTLTAEAQDRDGFIRKVEFFRDTTLVATVTNAPFTTTLSFTNGRAFHQLLARATDDAGASALSQPVFISINFKPPRNDDFANRVPITGLEVLAVEDGTWATLEAGEPNPDGRNSSIWWAWTAPESGRYTVTASADCCQWPALAIFTGSSLPGLVLVTNSADRVENLSYSAQVVIDATTGTQYQIAVEDPGLVSVHIANTTPPVVLISSPADGTTVFEGDSLQLSADVSDGGTVARVDFYLDSALVGTATNPPFTVIVPDLYYGLWSIRARATDNLGVSSFSPGVSIHVNLKPPQNDNFDNRILLHGAVTSTTGALWAATIEPGEPDLGRELSQSVWWSWMPPLSGTAVLTFSSYFRHRIAVYTGSQLTNLTLLAKAPGDSDSYFGQLVFDAVAGTPCQISFASSYGDGTSLAFSLFLDARQLGPLESLPDGRIHGVFQTTFDETWIVEASDDLIQWSSISTNLPLDGTFEFDDFGAPNQTRRFYRVKSAR